MSVSDGQKVDAAVTNAAFMSRTTDTSTTGKVDLNNADAASGTAIVNTQRELNGQASFTGDAVNGAENRKPTWTSDAIGTANQAVKDRVDSVQTVVEANQTGVAANTADIADIRTTTGTSDGDTDMGSYVAGTNGFNLTAAQNTKTNIQELIEEVDAKANNSLNNLASVAVNTPILPDTTSLHDFGSSSLWWQNLFCEQLIINATGGGSRVAVSFPEVTPSGETNVGAFRNTANGEEIALFTQNISGAFASGSLFVETGNQTNAGVFGSGLLNIKTGDSSNGPSGGINLEIGSAGTTKGEITFKNGSEGTSGHVWTSTGINGEGGWAAPSGGGGTNGNEATLLQNVGIAASASAGALTISLKQADGSTDPSTGSAAARVAYRSTTFTSGSYSINETTGALSTVISSGSTAGFSSTKEYLYVYAIDNAGTTELAWSATIFDEQLLVSTTAEGGAGGADTATTMYSTTARTSVAHRLIGVLRFDSMTPGTWINPVNVSLNRFSQYTLGSIQIFGSSGTWIKPANVRAIEVEVWGAGGAGGGAGATGASSNAVGAGGGGGGYSRSFIEVGLGSSETVTIGAGGVGGTANGPNGGTTSFGSHLSATGGSGGVASGSVASKTTLQNGGAGGAGSGGDSNLSGERGGPAYAAPANNDVFSGRGGNTIFFSGGGGARMSVGGSSLAGLAASASGSGGSGAANGTSSGAQNGGSGGNGFCLVREYY